MNDDLENHGYTQHEQQTSQIATLTSLVMAFHHGLLEEGATQEQALTLTQTWLAAMTSRGGDE